jgi:hypothetical protein
VESSANLIKTIRKSVRINIYYNRVPLVLSFTSIIIIGTTTTTTNNATTTYNYCTYLVSRGSHEVRNIFIYLIRFKPIFVQSSIILLYVHIYLSKYIKCLYSFIHSFFLFLLLTI